MTLPHQSVSRRHHQHQYRGVLCQATTWMKGGEILRPAPDAPQRTRSSLAGLIDDAVASLPLPAVDQPVTVLDMGSSWRPQRRLPDARLRRGLRRAPTSPFRRSTATWPATTSISFSPTWRRPGAPASLPRVFTPERWGPRFTALSCRPVRSTSPRALTPSTGSTGCPWPTCPISSPTAGRFRREHHSRRRRRSRLLSRDRPSATWSGSWNAGRESWSRARNFCWPARAILTKSAWATGSMTSPERRPPRPGRCRQN